MRILATLLSVLMIVALVNAFGYDFNGKRKRQPNIWHMHARIRPDRGCPLNPIQPDGKLPPKRTLKTEGVFQVSRLKPDQSFISNGWASITPRDKCTVFVFDVDTSKGFGKTCHLVFDMPLEQDAPGLYRSVGPGKFTFQYFSAFAPPPTVNVTWNTLPPLAPIPPLIVKELLPWTSHVIESAPCYLPIEGTNKITRSGMLCSLHSNFQFKQSNTRCPLGLYTIITDAFSTQ